MNYQSMVIFNGKTPGVVAFDKDKFEIATENNQAKIQIKINVFILPNILYDLHEAIKQDKTMKGAIGIVGPDYFYPCGNDKFTEKVIRLSGQYGLIPVVITHEHKPRRRSEVGKEKRKSG